MLLLSLIYTKAQHNWSNYKKHIMRTNTLNIVSNSTGNIKCAFLSILPLKTVVLNNHIVVKINGLDSNYKCDFLDIIQTILN